MGRRKAIDIDIVYVYNLFSVTTSIMCSCWIDQYSTIQDEEFLALVYLTSDSKSTDNYNGIFFPLFYTGWSLIPSSMRDRAISSTHSPLGICPSSALRIRYSTVQDQQRSCIFKFLHNRILELRKEALLSFKERVNFLPSLG